MLINDWLVLQLNLQPEFLSLLWAEMVDLILENNKVINLCLQKIRQEQGMGRVMVNAASFR